MLSSSSSTAFNYSLEYSESISSSNVVDILIFMGGSSTGKTIFFKKTVSILSLTILEANTPSCFAARDSTIRGFFSRQIPIYNT